MTIIVFLIDTSASMYQRAYLGGRPTLLDVAKGAVETFVKVRQRSPESRGDRYMLLTFDDPPHNIKAGWKENLATFMNELKNLQCFSMTTMGAALKQAFDLLNLNRMQTGIDTYGQGRCPFFLEPSVIVVITDGGKLSSVNGVHEDFNLPMHSPIPGSELTREPFRWDQRLFALVLRLAGTPAVDRDTGLVPSDSSPIDAMCEVTGGRSYCITSHRMLMQCIDSLVQKVQNGVVINFEKIGPDPPLQNEKGEDLEDSDSQTEKEEPTNLLDAGSERVNGLFSAQNTSWHTCRKLIYVPKAQTKGFALGFWPIPESFWPELTATALLPRSAHPNVKFTCTSQEPMVIENLPFDKYELEPSPLTQFILARKQPTTCWQVFVSNSYKSSEVGHPFGYLKASTNLSCVNLFVMPYNYPVLLPLLDELFKVHRLKPTNEWRTQFQNYMRTMPAYYAGPLRRALSRMGTPQGLAQTLIPDNAENSLSYCVLNYLKRMKNQAKVEFDLLCNDVLTRQNNAAKAANSVNLEQIRVPHKAVLKKELVTHPLLQDKFNAQREQILQSEFGGFVIGVDRQRWQSGQSFRNPFDIPRDRLMHQVARMRNNFLQPDYKLADDDSAHSMPVSQMGNYQEYLKRQTPQLREIESTPVRQHMFGNPFKIDKRMMVDEADIDLVGTPGTNRTSKRNTNIVDPASTKLPNKRKPGPIPREFVIRKPSIDGTPPASPCPSPIPSPVPWFDTPLHPVEQDYAPMDTNMEVAHYSINGSSHSDQEKMNESIRSRSPSPPFSGGEIPYYALPMDSGIIESPIMNSYPDFSPTNSTPESLPKEEKYISLILKEVNNVNNHNAIHENAAKETVNDKEIEKHNIEVRKTLNRLVRRPGKNFTELFNEIKSLKGESKVQVQVLRHIVVESLRFKRQQLAEMLESQIQVILSTENNLDNKSNT